MGRLPLYRDTDDDNDIFKLSLPKGYKAGRLAELMRANKTSGNKVILKALDDLWERQLGKLPAAFDRIGLESVIFDYEIHNYSDYIRSSKEVMVFGFGLDRFLAVNREALYDRIGDESKSTIIMFAGVGDLNSPPRPRPFDEPYYQQLTDLDTSPPSEEPPRWHPILLRPAIGWSLGFTLVTDEYAFVAPLDLNMGYALVWKKVEHLSYYEGMYYLLRQTARSHWIESRDT